MNLSSTPGWVWNVFLKRIEETPVGTCFVINPRVAITCYHVVFDKSRGDIERANTLILKADKKTVRVQNIHCHRYLDLAVLELAEEVTHHAPILFNRTGFNYSKNQHDYIALGFPQNQGGSTFTTRTIAASQLDTPQETTQEGSISFIKASTGVSEGFSGGPMCSQKGSDLAVMAINTLGGVRSTVGGFTTCDALIDYLFQLTRDTDNDFRPSHIIDWENWCNEAPTETEIAATVRNQQLRYCKLHGFESPTVTVPIVFQGKVYNETFVYVPPSKKDSTEHQGFWIQQTVMLGELSGNPDRPLCNINLRIIEKLISSLSNESNIQFYLPTEMQWCAAVTAGNPLSIARANQYKSDTSRAISRTSSEINALDIYPTPMGMYEFINTPDTSRAKALCAKRRHNGDMHNIEISKTQNEGSITFRLVCLELPQTLSQQEK